MTIVQRCQLSRYYSKRKRLKQPIVLDKKIKNALQIAHDRVFLYHEKQLEALGSGTDWSYRDDQGNILGQYVREWNA